MVRYSITYEAKAHGMPEWQTAGPVTVEADRELPAPYRCTTSRQERVAFSDLLNAAREALRLQGWTAFRFPVSLTILRPPQ
jgi:hypothetical protein